MRVLINNYNKENKIMDSEYPKKIRCEHCDSVLAYDKSDIRIGQLGLAFIDCPLCDSEICFEDEEEGLRLTKDNIEFPTHFFKPRVENISNISSSKIEACIKEGVEHLRKYGEDFAWYAESSNTHITVFKMDGDEGYWVIVAPNFYSTHIPFEEEDYEDY